MILDKLQTELKNAMKNYDKATMIGLRNIIGKLKTSQIDKGDQLTNNESILILKSIAKKLIDAADQYKKAGR